MIEPKDRSNEKLATELLGGSPSAECLLEIAARLRSMQLPRDTYELFIEAVTEHWGEKCPDFEPACATCQIWAVVDQITAMPLPPTPEGER